MVCSCIAAVDGVGRRRRWQSGAQEEMEAMIGALTAVISALRAPASGGIRERGIWTTRWDRRGVHLLAERGAAEAADATSTPAAGWSSGRRSGCHPLVRTRGAARAGQRGPGPVLALGPQAPPMPTPTRSGSSYLLVYMQSIVCSVYAVSTPYEESAPVPLLTWLLTHITQLMHQLPL
jgi:hypothetical protein